MVSRPTTRLLAAVAVLATSLAVAPRTTRPANAATPVSVDRSVESVVLPGSTFNYWSAGPEVSVRRPQILRGDPVPNMPIHQLYPSDCEDEAGNDHDPSTDHSCTQKPDLFLGGISAVKKGAPVDRLLGYKWTASGYQQIPLQVDERFIRFLSNNQSGFAFYSGVDQHLTYAFDYERFRYTDNDPTNPCLSAPRKGIVSEPDPIAGLDDNDEVSFLWRDTGAAAPVGAPLPAGIKNAYTVRLVDPSDPTNTRFAYVMLANPGGPSPAFDASNGYVHYERDADADIHRFSESSYENYGNAPKGPYYDPATGTCVLSPIRQRRPADTAWVTTDTYKFRYDGRWLMTELHIKQADGSYGPDLIDRWKARAFQQDPESETPCCGYEEEDTNWGGSSILFGERSGPVRTIRETWGADSGTNVVRREIFYRDTIDFKTFLRVHVIPPLDGIYAQWDYNAGKMTRYYNPVSITGVPVDGRGDEVFGNLDDPCNTKYDYPRRDTVDVLYRQVYRQAGLCALPYHQSIDLPDPQHSGLQALNWEQVSGPYGAVVDRYNIEQVTPGGAVQNLFAVPYYRDDSCFDDGTGSDPGPRLRPRSTNEPQTYINPANPGGTVRPRGCWNTSQGDPNPAYAPQGDIRWYQGSIGTHGVHLLFLAETDNASMPFPLTEIDAVQRMVVLRGANLGNVGDKYGRWVEFPFVVNATPV